METSKFWSTVFAESLNEDAPTAWELDFYGDDAVDVEDGIEAEDKDGLVIGFDKVTRLDGSVDIYGSYNDTNNAEGPDTEFEEHFENEEEYQAFLARESFFDRW